MNKEHDVKSAKTKTVKSNDHTIKADDEPTLKDTDALKADAKRSIEGLRIYQSARSLEDAIYELVKLLPDTESYGLADGLRRASAACAHYISQAHSQFSFSLKIESLHEARRAAETAIYLLEQHEERKYGKVARLIEEYTGVIKQSWGLIKWLRNRRFEQQAKASVRASDELAAARR